LRTIVTRATQGKAKDFNRRWTQIEYADETQISANSFNASCSLRNWNLQTKNQLEFLYLSAFHLRSIRVHLRSNFEIRPLPEDPDCHDLCKNDNSDCKNSVPRRRHDSLSAISSRLLNPWQGSPPTPGAIGTIARKTVELAGFSGKMQWKFYGIFLTCTESRPIFPLVLHLTPVTGKKRWMGLRQQF